MKHWLVVSGEAHYTAAPFEDFLTSGQMPGPDHDLDPRDAGLSWAMFAAETEDEALDLAREWDERDFVISGRDEANEARAEGAYRSIRTAVKDGYLPPEVGLEMALHIVVNEPYLFTLA